MNITPSNQSPAAIDKIDRRITNYKSRLLTEAQAAAMLDDLKEVVKKAEPRTPEIAGN
jgi:hypothetical protein